MENKINKCKVEGCNNSLYAKGVCKKHYNKARVSIIGLHKCSVEGCGNKARYKKDGRCTKHHYQILEGKQCSTPNCHCTVFANNKCLTHYNKEVYAKKLAIKLSKLKEEQESRETLSDYIKEEILTREEVYPIVSMAQEPVVSVEEEHRGFFNKLFKKVFRRG